MIFVVYNFIFN